MRLPFNPNHQPLGFVSFRKCGEQLLIKTPEGRRIWITLTETKNYGARVAVTADDDVKLVRGEICRKEDLYDNPLICSDEPEEEIECGYS